MDKVKNVNDLIKIGDAIAVLCRKTCHPGVFCPDAYCQEMWDAFEDVERIALEPKTGTWDINYLSDIYRYRCSACNAVHRARYDFCPSCGAKMEG